MSATQLPNVCDAVPNVCDAVLLSEALLSEVRHADGMPVASSRRHEQKRTSLIQALINSIAKPARGGATMSDRERSRAEVFRFGNVSSVVFR